MSFDTRVVVLQPGGTVINEEWRRRRDAPGDSPADSPLSRAGVAAEALGLALGPFGLGEALLPRPWARACFLSALS